MAAEDWTMSPIAEVLSLFAYLMLGCFSGPADKPEFRIDLIEETGYVDTIIVKRTKAGFDLYDSVDGSLKKMATVGWAADSRTVMIYQDESGRAERVDASPLADPLRELSDDRPQAAVVQGVKLRLAKSGEVVVLDRVGKRKTLVVH